MISRTVINSLANASAEFMHASVRAIWETAYRDTIGISNSGPTLQCVSADIACVASGDRVLVAPDDSGARIGYVVRDVQPDGRGVTLLLLEIV
jgi:arginine/ornithine N-succinyltransferase beta subunit